MNLKQTKPATSADYKRIIENNLNLNRTPTPRLLKRYEIERAFTAEDCKTLVSLYTPNPNDFAEVHKNAEPSYDTIEQEIFFYIDEDTGEKIYDTELMLEEFQDKLNQLNEDN